MAHFLTKIRLTLEMIQFQHSVFALPFAFTGAVLAWRESGFDNEGLGWKLVLILVSMVAARSAAMGFNRVIDADVDARNPRTAKRHLPAGLLSSKFAWIFVGGSAVVFFLAAAALNPLCMHLAPLALIIVLCYSFTKRFTSLSHLVLGLALGIAPTAAWIAMRGSLDLRILWLTGAVLLWTAGFDIIYSCQDFEFDRANGLFSLPSRLGLAKALTVARIFHLGMLLCLSTLVVQFQLGPLAMAGVAVVAVLLVYEHRLVRADDLSRVNAAFFAVNGYVSMLFFFFWTADILLYAAYFR